MIAFVKGSVLSVDSDELVVLTSGGVGYRIVMPAREVQQCLVGDTVEIHTCTLVREDAITLAGFLSADERKLFSKLIDISGVGPKMGLDILNVFTPVELQNAVFTKNTALLSKVPRIGAKKAEKLIIDLDSIMRNCHFLPTVALRPAVAPPLSSTSSETRSALLNLGFTESIVNEAIKALEQDASDLDVNAAVKWTLAWLKNR